MAKKDTTAGTNVATPPTTPDTGKAPSEKPAKSPGRPKGFSTKDGDVFKTVTPQPTDKKIAPQAQNIANLVAAAGTKGISRKELVEKMKGVVVTRQPESRILSYYQKLLVENGFVTVDSAPAASETKEAETAGKEG